MSRGERRGRIVVVVSATPSSPAPATDRRAETCSEGPSIVSVDAMVAYDNDGLMLWPVGPRRNGFGQLYNHGWHDVSQPHSGPCEVLAFMDTTGAKFMLILLMLRHHPLRALCRSVENNRRTNRSGGTDRLPSPTRINSSVCLSVRTCLQIRYSAEKGTGPTDSVNYSLKS